MFSCYRHSLLQKKLVGATDISVHTVTFYIVLNEILASNLRIYEARFIDKL